MATTETPMAAPALTPRAEAAFRAVTIVSVALLAIAAAVLSYSGLRDAALRAEINPDLAWIFPLVIDGLTFVGSIGVVYAVLTRTSPWYPWFLTLLGVGISTTGNIAVSPEDPISRMVHAAPPVVLALALEALLRVYRARAQTMLGEKGGAKSDQPEDRTAPVTSPAPEPLPVPVLPPTPTQVVEPDPEPDPEPESESESAPGPDPEPDPEIEPDPEPEPAPAPVSEPAFAQAEAKAAPALVPDLKHAGTPSIAPDPEVDPFVTAAPMRTPSSDSMDAPATPVAPAPPEVHQMVVEPPLTARDQLPEILMQEPDISGADLARRLNIDGSYARRLLREARDDNDDRDDQPSGQEALFSSQSA